jgi:hypothetical protein
MQHAYIVIATYAISQIYFYNIRAKHMKHDVAGGHGLPGDELL